MIFVSSALVQLLAGWSLVNHNPDLKGKEGEKREGYKHRLLASDSRPGEVALATATANSQ